MCQMAAVNKGDVHSFEVVKHNNILYKPIGYQLDFDSKGQARHTAILQDLNANSLTYCQLQEVQQFKKYY